MNPRSAHFQHKHTTIQQTNNIYSGFLTSSGSKSNSVQTDYVVIIINHPQETSNLLTSPSSLSLSPFAFFLPNNDILQLHNLPLSIPMSPPNWPQVLLLLLLTFLLLSFLATSSPLSTIAISRVSNKTLVCAILPSNNWGSFQYDLNCTTFPNGTTHHYPAGLNSYSAIAAGDGFLCGLVSPFSSNQSTMRWWDFEHNPHKDTIPDAKRVYLGPSLAALSAGDSHVCGLTRSSGELSCWRWPQLSIPSGLRPAQIAVGGDFVCALLAGGVIKCFGGDAGVVGNEPHGNYTTLAAGSSHACVITVNGRMDCWGVGSPEIAEKLPPIDSMALGDNRTCALDSNGKVHCWGRDIELPQDIANAPFVAIQARGDAICGVLMTNYSLVCWGSEAFRQTHVVFKQVLPGACAMTCPCLPLAGTGNICGNGAQVCRPCPTARSSLRPNSPISDKSTAHKRKRIIFIVLGSVGLFVGIIAIAFLLYLRFKRNNGRIHDSVRLRGRPVAVAQSVRSGTEHISHLLTKGHNATVEEYPIKVLLAFTDGFSDEHKIGSGSFGSVYRATLDDGLVVAIKRAESSASTSTSRPRTANPGENRRQDLESAFCSELGLLTRVNHKNLVRLFGYCKEGSERILVYEYMTNGTLHDHLHKTDQQRGSLLGTWPARIRVALDAARGIEYLHTYAVPPIIHRDIKSSNILLDDQWTAKVADFGLSLLHPDYSATVQEAGSNASTSAAGTVGYMDPEYYRLQHLTAKSDVYSFGVVLLEILSGCKVIQRYEESGTPKNVVEFAVPHIVADDLHKVLDERLAPPTPSEIEAVAYVGYLAADCVNPEGRDRPSMTEVVNGLERALAAIMGPASPSRSSTSRSL